MAKTRQQPTAGQDEADIVASLGAEPADPDDPAGPLVADEEAVRAAGAVDTESIRANSISTQTVNRKRGGEKNVTINEPLLQKYETITRLWPVNSLSILVKRLTGTQIEWPITSQPKNAVELYAAIKALHGRHEEATYEVFIRDSQIKANRGTGRITMPDTRDEIPPQPQPGQPMQPPPYYPQQPYPQGYPQQQPYAAPGYPQPVPQQPPQPGQPAPQQPPAVVHVQPAQNDPASMIGVMQQMFEMFRQMQAAAQPQQPQQPQQPVMPPPPAQNDPASMMAWMQQVFEMFRQVQASAQPQPPPQQQPMMPMPPPPQSNDPASMMAWMQQMFQMFQQVQASGQQPAGRGSHQPQQPAMNPMAAMMGMGGVPPVQPPPGMVFVPGWGMVSMEALAQAQAQAAGGGRPGPYGRRPYYGGGQGPGGGDPSQPPYQAGPYPGGGGYPQQPGGGYPPHPQQPPPPKSMAEQFRDATSVIRLATEIADEFRPQSEPQAAAAPPPQEVDDSPIKVIDTGPAKIVINKDSGSARFWETLVTNSPGIFKWVGEQAEAIQKAANEREAQKRRAQQPLPPGYVEVGPGYVPPPGYVPVPIDQIPPQHALPPQQQQPPAQPPLPPPPAQMPPPITQQPQAPAPRRTWDIPGVTR